MNTEDLINNYYRQQNGILKQYMAQLLDNRGAKYEPLIDRLGTMIVTQRDVEDFVKMMFDIYELGFLRAVREHEHLLQQLGYNVNVVHPE